MKWLTFYTWQVPINFLKCLNFEYNFIEMLRVQYSETTWVVGIAQLTHHEVQGGGKNPETEGRGIFAPTANRVVS